MLELFRVIPGWTHPPTCVLRMQVNGNRISVLCHHWCPGYALYYDFCKVVPGDLGEGKWSSITSVIIVKLHLS